jgi:hypothetical protein
MSPVSVLDVLGTYTLSPPNAGRGDSGTALV